MVNCCTIALFYCDPNGYVLLLREGVLRWGELCLNMCIMLSKWHPGFFNFSIWTFIPKHIVIYICTATNHKKCVSMITDTSKLVMFPQKSPPWRVVYAELAWFSQVSRSFTRQQWSEPLTLELLNPGLSRTCRGNPPQVGNPTCTHGCRLKFFLH